MEDQNTALKNEDTVVSLKVRFSSAVGQYGVAISSLSTMHVDSSVEDEEKVDDAYVDTCKEKVRADILICGTEDWYRDLVDAEYHTQGTYTVECLALVDSLDIEFKDVVVSPA